LQPLDDALNYAFKLCIHYITLPPLNCSVFLRLVPERS
jgi:hypothetical protein